MSTTDQKLLDDMQVNVNSLVQARGKLRGKLTRELKLVEDSFQDFSHDELCMHIEKCKTIRTDLVNFNQQIFALRVSLNTSENLLSKEAVEEEKYEDQISLILNQLLNIHRESSVDDNPINNADTPVVKIAPNKLKLPNIPLPEFSNEKGDNIQKFFRAFEAIINKHNISGYEKFMLLKNQVSNAPRKLIESLDIDQQSYVNAKELLLQAFDSNEQSKFEIIKLLADLKLHTGGDPYNFIGDLRTVIAGIKSLEITVDDVVGYFAWNGLNTAFQNHLTSITNKCKPNINEILDSIFEATQRFVKQRDNQKFNKFDRPRTDFAPKLGKFESNSNAMAVNLNSDKKYFPCVLCDSDKKSNDHSMKNCTVYDNARKKFNKLRALKACTKCSFRNHETDSCQFKFKSKCQNCNGSHMTYLCLRDSDKSNVEKKSFQKNSAANSNVTEIDDYASNDVINNLLYVEASQIFSQSPMILPTLTAHLCDENFETPITVFRDSGCQQTFICGAVADSCDLEIVKENVPLTIHGFNSSRKLGTKIVKIKIKFGDKTFEHEAICIDYIKTQFRVDGIQNVVSNFKNKGFNIADSQLEQKDCKLVGDIDLVLGTDADHMLTMNYRTFGNPEKPNSMSSFIETPIGVIFSGDLDKMKNNLQFIPKAFPEEKTSISMANTVKPATLPDLQIDSGAGENVTNIGNYGNEDSSFSKPKNNGDCSVESGRSPEPGQSPEPEVPEQFQDYDQVLTHSLNDYVSNYDYVNSLGNYDFLSSENFNACIDNDDDMCFLNYRQRHINFSKDIDWLDQELNAFLDVSSEVNDDRVDTETNSKLIDFVLANTEYDEEGRLTMPLTWNSKNAHLLSNNYNLAYKILESSLAKLKLDYDKLIMYDTVFKEQVSLNIIERIENLPKFLEEHPEASFLPHQGIFRMSRESSKLRIVFLSNMFQKKNNGISHNMAMLPGPNLNHKIATAVLMHRFDKHMVIFDIKKAFLNINLYDCDRNRLCFLWFKNVERGDFTVVAYRNLRLSFGLRPSPFLLSLGLYKILILDQCEDQYLQEIKKSIYNCIYVDNGSYSCNSEDELLKAYRALDEIFTPHKLFLQQFATNCTALQTVIDNENEVETDDEVKFFGLKWCRGKDTLKPNKINLDINANTKRKVLSSLNSVYDIYNVYTPVLLRAKLFVQTLQSDKNLSWDAVLSDEYCKQWSLIVKQANATPAIEIPRYVGDRNDNYALVAFTDASQDAYGVVIFIKNLDTGGSKYLLSKTKLINNSGPKKTMPSLEFQAIALGVEVLHETFDSLCGESVVIPISVKSLHLFSDNMACIQWINLYSVYFGKLQNVSVFVKNRLRAIDQLCQKFPVSFCHISGKDNPADYLTRPTSPKVLDRSNFFCGPDLLKYDIDSSPSDLKVTMPNPLCKLKDEVPENVGAKDSTAFNGTVCGNVSTGTVYPSVFNPYGNVCLSVCN